MNKDNVKGRECVVKYSRNAILESRKYRKYRDYLRAVLEYDRFYTEKETENIIKDLKLKKKKKETGG